MCLAEHPTTCQAAIDEPPIPLPLAIDLNLSEMEKT
jgi:hypothetical protein